MAKTAAEKAAEKAAKEAAAAAEEARRAALTQEERDAEDAAKAAPAPKPSKSTDPVTVKYLDHEGKPTERTFSPEVHGDAFAALADEFTATNASRIIA